MKFPEDKKERTKILVLIGIGAIVVLYLVYAFGLSPFLNNMKKLKEEIALEQSKLDQTLKEIRQMPLHRKQLEEIQKELAEYSGKYFLKPRLGNYTLEARDRIDEYLSKVGIKREKAVPPRDISFLPTMGSKPAKYNVAGCTAAVDIECSFHDFVRLMHIIETNDPFCCLTDLLIKPSVENPAIHSVHFELQWPIWKKKDIRDSSDEILYELLGEEHSASIKPEIKR
jgi:hypothetical protein